MINLLEKLYLEYSNDYLTVTKMAEHKQMTVEDMQTLINLGREYHENKSKYPDA